jgi:hypothetical protein
MSFFKKPLARMMRETASDHLVTAIQCGLCSCGPRLAPALWDALSRDTDAAG